MRVPWFLLALGIVAAGCLSPKSGLPAQTPSQADFYPLVRVFVDPQTHHQVEHVGYYDISEVQLEQFILSAQRTSIQQPRANYDSSRAIKCYVDPYSGFGGGTVFISIPVRGGSEAYDVYGLHIRSVAVSCLAQEHAVPARRILSEEIVQDSIQLIRLSTNSFAVRWTYTEAGAKKLVAFEEAHMGQKVQTVVGSFESPPSELVFRPMPPAFTNYNQWKESWLKRRTDKFFGVSEDDAEKIVAGLKSK